MAINLISARRMGVGLVACALSCVVVWSSMGSVSRAAPSQTKHRPVDILVVRDGWGGARRDTVRKVLEYTTREMWPYFPDRELSPLIVKPKGGPMVLFKRGPQGEIVVLLNTGKTFWCQYAFQFAHEFCHILCKYDDDPHGNDWFEESLCEMASLFTLRKMGKSWEHHPPFQHWKGYHKALTSYAQQRMDKAQLPKGKTLAQWYRDNAKALAKTATLRDKNLVVATVLLPMFEASPEHWRAVSYLNDAKPKKRQAFQQYMQDWHDHAPEKHKAFIKNIALQFEIKLK